MAVQALIKRAYVLVHNEEADAAMGSVMLTVL